MAKVSTTANRRTMSKYPEDGGAGPAPPTIPAWCLAGEAFWDLTPGTGTITNQGTLGAAADLTLVNTTLVAGSARFNGTTAYGSAPNNAGLDIIASEDQTVYIVMAFQASINNFGAIIGKYGASTGYVLATNGTTQGTYLTWTGVAAGASGGSPGVSAGTKVLIFFRRNVAANTVKAGYVKGGVLTDGSGLAQTGAGTSTNTGEFNIGSQQTHSGFFQKLDAFYAGAKQGLATDAELIALAAFAGVP